MWNLKHNIDIGFSYLIWLTAICAAVTIFSTSAEATDRSSIVVHGYTCGGEVSGVVICDQLPQASLWAIDCSESPTLPPGKAVKLARMALSALDLGELGGDASLQEIKLVPCGNTGWHYIIVFSVTQHCIPGSDPKIGSVSVAVLMDGQVIAPTNH